ncbi:MAG: hypothetical protein HN976_02825 [Lentisphaerae bacterium]|nr:hypothetical protein [Lentisphaerota bacterium]
MSNSSEPTANGTQPTGEPRVLKAFTSGDPTIAGGNAVNLSGQNAMAPVAAQAVSAILAVSQVGAEQCKPASKE